MARAVYTHTFCILPVMLVKKSEQCLLRPGLSRHGVLYQFGRDISGRIHILFVGGLSLFLQLLQFPVEFPQLRRHFRILPMNGRTSLAGIPIFRWHFLSGRILAHFTVKGDASHYRTLPCLFDFLPVDIEQQTKGASHALTSFPLFDPVFFSFLRCSLKPMSFKMVDGGRSMPDKVYLPVISWLKAVTSRSTFSLVTFA